MTSTRRQAAALALAITAFVLGVAGCGGDDDDAPAQSGGYSAPATEPAQGAPGGANGGDEREHSRPEAEPAPEPEPESEPERRYPSAPGSASSAEEAARQLQGVVPPDELAAGLERYRELREELTDGDPEGDEEARRELEELRQRYLQAVAEARAQEQGR